MGQHYFGAVGYHVQSLELGTLMSDSTRPQLCSSLSRASDINHLYIPSLSGWCEPSKKDHGPLSAMYVSANRFHPPTCRRGQRLFDVKACF
ncbi:hypothetical protein M378DRAFT_904082 [Amanita muscaria Koide BX008]|uniref:Uncharacterized protein n=1 Tax=Amanita muscaria (strain Koide BX008) TaxID=946122 RepID=A0A0C2RZ49_AMAMK|nr:hypothetical protein M378DRAFT_577237 [Amanita muscaria Koide BX008]KIL60943.1 hypothetical protein M378DRAFT_904082 [Amanita muscaria Koide BX008]